MLCPATSSVTTDPQAIALTHPLALKRTSEIMPSEIRAANSITSPHAGFSTWTMAVTSGRSPELRGCSKWSNTWGEYISRFYWLAFTVEEVTDSNHRIGAKRIVSLQPSITSTLDRLGLLDRVVACTKYCVDVCPALAANPKVIVHDSWSANVQQISAANPDLVICSVPYQMESLAEILKAGVPVLALAPKTLSDVYADIAHIANILGASARGEDLIAEMEQAFDEVRCKTHELVRDHPRPLVYCEEWGKPLIHSQPWVAELVEIAGGEFLGLAGKTTTAEAVLAADPDVILAAWC